MDAVETLLEIAATWLVADFISGIVHWDSRYRVLTSVLKQREPAFPGKAS